MSGKLTITSGGLSVSGTTSLEAIETSSQTLVDNLNADFLDGQEGAFYRNASNLNAGTLALLYGGTGSTTAAGARTNLGAAALAGSSTQDFSTQNLTVSGTTYNMLTLSRTTANGASILFQNSSGNLGKLGFDGSGNLIVGKGTTTDGAADLLKITPAGVTTFYNSVTASSFIKSGGTASQFLKADGSVDTNAYLPLSGGTLTGTIIANNPITEPVIQKTSESGLVILRMLSTGQSHDKGLGLSLYGDLIFGNWSSVASLSSTWDKVWHAGNDGAGSGLDADLLDGLHIHAGRNNEANKVVRTDGSGYIQCGYINSSSGDEKNNTNAAYVWGTNGSDSYLRTYNTSALSVAYAANSASSTRLETNYIGGVQTNPQTYFNNGVGLKVAMTRIAGT